MIVVCCDSRRLSSSVIQLGTHTSIGVSGQQKLSRYWSAEKETRRQTSVGRGKCGELTVGTGRVG